MRARMITLTVTLLGLVSVGYADIYQWEYIDPGHPELGVRQSATLCPGGAGVSTTTYDLTWRDLTQAYLIGADLSSKNLNSATLARADLSQANCRNSEFSRVNLTSANMSRGDFYGTNFSLGTLANADLTDAVVTYANFWETGLTSTQLYSTASYKNGDLTGIGCLLNNMCGWNFAGQRLSYANLGRAALINTDFRRADLSHAILNDALLTNADFTDAIIAGAQFWRVTIPTRDFTAAQFYSTASYKNGDLNGIMLAGCNLTGWNLAGKNLARADFRGTVLTNADLNHADFGGANFGIWYGIGPATFVGANLTQANLSGATFNGAVLNCADARGAVGLNLNNAQSSSNLIGPDGRIAGLSLSGGQQLFVRNYSGTSPIPIRVQSGMAMGSDGVLTMNLDANPWTSTVSFDQSVDVALGGTLQLGFAAGVDAASQVGRTFDLFDWTGVNSVGSFAVIDGGSYQWDLSHLYTTGEVTLVPEPATLSLLGLGGLAILRRRKSA